MTRPLDVSIDMREKVADALAHNDECGPGPVSREEYLADADEILKLIRYDDLKRWANRLAESLTAMVESYDNMPGLGAQQVLYEYERAMAPLNQGRPS